MVSYRLKYIENFSNHLRLADFGTIDPVAFEVVAEPDLGPVFQVDANLVRIDVEKAHSG